MNKKKSLKDEVKEWLLQQGYPLEMRVASALRKSNFEVRQSHYYVDFQSGDHREIDILATRYDKIGLLEIAFLIECKTSNKPLILFTSDSTISGYNSLFAFGITSNKAKEALIQKDVDLFSLPYYPKKNRVAYSATVAFTSGLDTAYKAAMSATKAALGRKIDLIDEGRSSIPFQFSFPVIVVDCPMFECFLENEEMVVQEISDSNLFYSNHHGEEPSCCIRIIRSENLQDFCNEVDKLAETLVKVFEPIIKIEWDKMRNQPLEPIR